jgi:hypothetical protein
MLRSVIAIAMLSPGLRHRRNACLKVFRDSRSKDLSAEKTAKRPKADCKCAKKFVIQLAVQSDELTIRTRLDGPAKEQRGLG